MAGLRLERVPAGAGLAMSCQPMAANQHGSLGSAMARPPCVVAGQHPSRTLSRVSEDGREPEDEAERQGQTGAGHYLAEVQVPPAKVLSTTDARIFL